MAEELEFVGFVGKCMSSPQSYASGMSQWRTPTAKQIATKALTELEQARAKDIAAHERNMPKIEANQAQRDRIVALMKEIGIPDSYSEVDHKSRARFPKRIRHDAGYIGDMNRNLRVNDGFASATASYNTMKARYDEYAAKAEEEDARAKAEAERQAAAALEKRRQDLKLVEIILRYGLPETSEWADVLSALREKDQRMDLAAAMYQTRGDWSEGYYRVSDALQRFVVSTPQDAEIQTDILSCFNDDIDGRVFRDTFWSYGKLFAEAQDQQLATDVQTALANVGND